MIYDLTCPHHFWFNDLAYPYHITKKKNDVQKSKNKNNKHKRNIIWINPQLINVH